MSFNGQLLATGGVAECLTDSVQVFGGSSGVALYTMDYDASDAGGLYNGTPTDVTFGAEGQINTAARFNGSSSRITTGSFNLSNTGNSSFSCWFKTTLNSTTPQSIVEPDPLTSNGLVIPLVRSGVLRLAYYSLDTNGSVDGTTSVIDGNWHHLTMVFDNSVGTVKFFLDGETNTPEVSHSFTSGNSHNMFTGDSAIGALSTNFCFFDGDLDQVRIFNKALNSTEVGTLYTETACVYTCTTDTINYPSTTNTAYYKLDNNPNDSAGANDGTAYNVTYKFGRFNQAANFDGTAYVDTGYTVASSTEASISFWVNIDAYTNYGSFVGDSTSAVAQCRFFLGQGSIINNPGKLWVSVGNGSSGFANESAISLTPYGLKTWFNIVGTINGTSINIYINGDLVQSMTSTVSYVGGGQHPYFLGGWGNSLHSQCQLDQIRFFNDELTSNQVTELYKEKPCPAPSNFATTLYNGNSNTAGQLVASVGFQPDLTWIKQTNANVRHLITDSITGPSVYQGAGITTHSNETFVSNTYGEFTSFDANGFIVQFWSSSQYFNNTGFDYVAWNWKAGGAKVPNTNGGTNSQVSANTAAGFSIVNWSGNNSTTTVGHSLNSPPQVVIRKNLGVSDWAFDTTAIDGSFDYLFLNSSAAKTNHSALSAPTATVFSTGGSAFNTPAMIAYCWHTVSGYSRISTYDGTSGNTTVYTTDDDTSGGSNPFQPSFVMIKKTNSATNANWVILDAARGSNTLFPDTNSAEVVRSGLITYNSNGFTLTQVGSVSQVNNNGDSYLYMAFK